jgi:DNA-directed RNA polymerase subunit RPC12/RpoP
MPDNVYRCPECGANLKMAKPVPDGKKIKCPKCEKIFMPSAAGPAAPKPKPAAAPPPPAPVAAAPKAKRPADDDDDGGTYGVVTEAPPPAPPKEPLDLDDDEDDSPAERKKKKAAKAKKKKEPEDPLKKTFPKGKRGPAAAALMAPTNQLLGTSAIAAVSCVISVMVLLWPIVFSEDKPNDLLERFAWMGVIAGAFAYNAVIAAGAVKMQNVDSYVWGMIASVLMVLPVNWFLAWPSFKWFLDFVSNPKLVGPESSLLFWGVTMVTVCGWYVFVGVWNLKVLQDPVVKEGFSEKRVDY